MSKRVRAWKEKYRKSLEVSNFLTSENAQLYEEIFDLSKNLDEIVETVLRLNNLSIVKRSPCTMIVERVPVGFVHVELTNDNEELEQTDFRNLDTASKTYILHELSLFVERYPEKCTIGCHAVFQDKFKSSYFINPEGLKNISPEAVAGILLKKTTNIIKDIQKLL